MASTAKEHCNNYTASPPRSSKTDAAASTLPAVKYTDAKETVCSTGKSKLKMNCVTRSKIHASKYCAPQINTPPDRKPLDCGLADCKPLCKNPNCNPLARVCVTRCKTFFNSNHCKTNCNRPLDCSPQIISQHNIRLSVSPHAVSPQRGFA